MESASIRVSDAKLRAVHADDLDFQPFEDRILSVWRAKIFVAAFAIVAGLAGYLAESLLFREYETSVVVRPQLPAALMEFSAVLKDTNGNWHGIDGISDAAYDLFLRNAQDIGTRESELMANRSMFPGVNLDDRLALSRLSEKFSVIATDGKTGPGGKSTTLILRSKKGWQAVSFLDRYVADLVATTSSLMLDGGRNALETLRNGYQRDLARLRAQRDIAARQNALAYDEAMKTAIAAGIEGPITSNLVSTAIIVNGSASAQVPLYYYGRKILEHEITNIESHIGNDLAIPEFANIQASIKDIDGRLAAVAQMKIQPVAVRPASDSGKIASPSPVGVVLLCLGAGGLCGYFTATIRNRRKLVRDA